MRGGEQMKNKLFIAIVVYSLFFIHVSSPHFPMIRNNYMHNGSDTYPTLTLLDALARR